MRLAAFDSRIAKAEAEYLRQNGTRRWWHYLLLSGTVLIGLPYLAPRLLPMGFPTGFPHSLAFGYAPPILGPAVLLLILLGANYLFALLLIVQTSIVGMQSINREIQSGNWQALHLTRVNDWQIVSGKWWGAIRFFWKDFALAALPPVVLSYIVMTTDYLFLFDIDRAESLCRPLWGVFRAYCSRQIYAMPMVAQPKLVHLNLLDNLVLALALSVAMAMAMMALSIAIGQLAALISRRELLAQVGLIAMVRLIVGTVLIATMIGLALWKEDTDIRWATDNVISCDANLRYDWLDCNKARAQRVILRGTETLEVALMPLVDGGAMLRVNLLQPVATKLFLLRTLISGGMALSLYGLLTWVALRLSTWLSRRQVLVGS